MMPAFADWYGHMLKPDSELLLLHTVRGRLPEVGSEIGETMASPWGFFLPGRSYNTCPLLFTWEIALTSRLR
jgi:hypothetical protein